MKARDLKFGDQIRSNYHLLYWVLDVQIKNGTVTLQLDGSRPWTTTLPENTEVDLISGP